MQAIHQRLRFAGDKGRKAGLLVGGQEPQAQQLRPEDAWLKVNLFQDVCLWGPQSPFRELTAPGVPLSDAPGSCLPAEAPFRPPPWNLKSIHGSPSRAWRVTLSLGSPVAQGSAWNRPFDLQIQTPGLTGYYSPDLPCPAWATRLDSKSLTGGMRPLHLPRAGAQPLSPTQPLSPGAWHTPHP